MPVKNNRCTLKVLPGNPVEWHPVSGPEYANIPKTLEHA